MMLMLYLSGSRLRHLAGAGSPSIPAAVWMVAFKSYRLERLKIFLNPWNDPAIKVFRSFSLCCPLAPADLRRRGSATACRSSLSAGAAYGFYSIRHCGGKRLPSASRSSFFFSGFWWSGVFSFPFKAPDLFGTLLAAGLTMVIALEAFINIAGVIGTDPPEGIDPAFFSVYGVPH